MDNFENPVVAADAEVSISLERDSSGRWRGDYEGRMGILSRRGNVCEIPR
jgi:hypothetical protein